MKAAVDAIPGFEFVWQFVTAGAFLGALVAYPRRKADPTLDPFDLVVRWSVWSLVLGALALLIFEMAS